MTSPQAMAPVLSFHEVSKTYPATPPVHALREITLTVQRGDHVAIQGPSGSGKSTLLNLAGLLDTPTGGQLHLDGVDVTTLREAERTALRAHRIGVVFQAFHLLPYRTALDNVALAQLYRASPRRKRAAAAAEALGTVGLAHRAHALPGTLSGGEKQRVAIARALVNQPSLLLADEPTGNLDSAMSFDILAVLDELNTTGYTIMVITHDATVAARAGRTVTIADGRLTET